MKWQFTHPEWLLLLIPALAWTLWLALKTYVQLAPWRRWLALALRLVVLLCLALAVAGLQWLRPREGMNVYFLLDRSDSIPSVQQESARKYVNQVAAAKLKDDKGGVVVFGTDAALESTVNPVVDLQRVNAVVGSERTDLASAIRLATAAFPETGQKRIVILSDGNENLGDAVAAVSAARPLGVSVDVLPLGVERASDVAIQKLSVPARLKKGQTFEAKVIVTADRAQRATLRFYRNEQYMGEQEVGLEPGKNAFGLPQTLDAPGFYSYSVTVEAKNDLVPQNNRAAGFTSVTGEPRVLVASDDPAKDRDLVAALRTSRFEVSTVTGEGFPGLLAELQSYDAIFLNNLSAGDLGLDRMKLLESAVRDFGVGLVCVGGDQTYAAGGYRGTPLEAMLPVDMELSSRKVLPRGAMVLVMHGMEFPGANQVARDTAIAALNALGPQDELGVVLWDGNERWLIQLQSVGDKKEAGRQIAGMNQGDLPNFQNVMNMAYMGLKASKANLKHIIVFSDGDPNPPKKALMDEIVNEKITVSTVMIGGHVQPNNMIWMADYGKGRFYDVNVANAGKLPEIFIKETAVILKSAIFEEPFRPRQVAATELLRGIDPASYPPLLGYVCSSLKPRAELALVSPQDDPILAHWQYGLGRAAAFTSDARARWAKNWLGWDKYRQFWVQTALWSLRRLESADFSSEVVVDKGEGTISVEAVDQQGNYRNFLSLQAAVVSPRGERQTVRLEQTGPGRYEVKFPTREVGSYLVNLTEIKDGRVRASQVVGASVNYSPEFIATEPNQALLRQLAELGGGRLVNPADPAANPFLHHREKTFQPIDLWEWLLQSAVFLFLLDIAVRRIHVDREEWLKATENLRRLVCFWKRPAPPVASDESLASLLTRRDEVRSRQSSAPPVAPRAELFRPASAPVAPLPGTAPPPDSVKPVVPAAPAENAPAKGPESSASRLLEAKRRALRNKQSGGN